MNNLISIIVPVYNVENYIEQCIESLMSQTYKNIEIILVDDGSTDSSGEKCEQYKELDSRIKVYHKCNGGLSSARNYGLQYAKGDYIGFVDSDDYVDENMYETLLNACVDNNVKLACCRWEYEPEQKETRYQTPEPTHIRQVITDDMLLNSILGEKKEYFSTISVWDRLYHRSILEGLVFPEGKCYEDLVFSIHAIIRAGSCVFIDEAYYKYRIREGSITQDNIHPQLSEKLYTDEIPLKLEQIDTIVKYGKYNLANVVRMIYYSQFLEYKAFAKDDKVKITEDALDKLKLTYLEILKTEASYKIKLYSILKMRCPNLFAKYYGLKNRCRG